MALSLLVIYTHRRSRVGAHHLWRPAAESGVARGFHQSGEYCAEPRGFHCGQLRQGERGRVHGQWEAAATRIAQ